MYVENVRVTHSSHTDADRHFRFGWALIFLSHVDDESEVQNTVVIAGWFCHQAIGTIGPEASARFSSRQHTVPIRTSGAHVSLATRAHATLFKASVPLPGTLLAPAPGFQYQQT
jgi:hypothetical protein